MSDIPQAADSGPEDDPLQAARGDREAFGRLFDRFYPDVFRYALRRMLVRAAAEDVTSDVFLQVARHLRSFGGETLQDFRRWLFRIASNAINARLRQSLRRQELLEAAVRLGAVHVPDADPLPLHGDPLDWSEVYAALEQLSERDQELLSLRYFAGLETSQIAGTLGMTDGAVRTALSRTLQHLRDRLRTTASTRVPDDPSSG